VESRFDEEKAKVGALLASEGTEMFLGNPEAEDGLQPSDELMRIVRWIQMYQ